jgi:hypothetical protein
VHLLHPHDADLAAAAVRHQQEHDGVEVADVVGREQGGAGARDVLAAAHAHRPEQPQREVEDADADRPDEAVAAVVRRRRRHAGQSA